MPLNCYPLTFDPVYKDYIWGGTRIAKRYGRATAPSRCAESWECSTRPEGMSVVNSGPLRGRTLTDIIRDDGNGLLGTAHSGDFPLLIKIIDARERLSVQVHPDETTAGGGGEPKTEAWYILAADRGASLYCGLQPGVKPETLAAAAGGNDPEAMTRLLREQPVAAGDVVFVPGGSVHAIGAGILLLEVQQNSDTTYRLHDWGRTGTDGKPRELHIEKALSVIDWDKAGDKTGTVAARRPVGGPPAGLFRTRVTCPWFVMEETGITQPLSVSNNGHGFQILFAVSGGLKVLHDNGATELAAGSTLMIPAMLSAYTLQPSGNGSSAVVVRIRLPD